MAKFFHNGNCDHSFISDESYCLVPNNLILTSDGKLVAFTRRSHLATEKPIGTEQEVFAGDETEYFLLRILGRVASRKYAHLKMKEITKMGACPFIHKLSELLETQYDISAEEFFSNAPKIPLYRIPCGLPQQLRPNRPTLPQRVYVRSRKHYFPVII